MAANGGLELAAEQTTASPQRYRDKVVIITGGSKGIGEGCVRVFVRHGAKVVFCVRGEKEGRLVEADVNKTGPGQAVFLQCDMTKEVEIKSLVEKTVELFGRLDCLINNAGTHPTHMPIDDFSADDFRKLLDMNVVSYFLCAKYALPYLRKTEGSIINDSSLVASLGQLGAVTYVSTKGAIDAMTRALAVDEAKYNVRVNTFSPGNVWTPMWENGAKTSGDYEGTVQGGTDAQLLGRMGTLEECGLVCLFLAADATFCTGINIPVSGGAELNYGRKNRRTEGGIYS